MNFLENQLFGVSVALGLDVEEPELTKGGEIWEDIVVVQLHVIDVIILSFAKMALSKTLLIIVEMN